MMRCWKCSWFKHDSQGSSVGICEFRDGRPTVLEGSSACGFFRQNKFLPWAHMDKLYDCLKMTGGRS